MPRKVPLAKRQTEMAVVGPYDAGRLRARASEDHNVFSLGSKMKGSGHCLLG